MKKVVVIGPESTGKTVMARFLAGFFKTAWVPEFARYYIDNLNRPYHKEDLLKIAEGQLKWEDEKASTTNDLLICDTDLIVIKVWSEYKYHSCAQKILTEIQNRKYDLYLLMGTDIPYEKDPQRENPKLRDYFYGIYKKELDRPDVKYVEIWGSMEERKKKAIKAITGLTH